MKTFQEFLEEGRKKRIAKLADKIGKSVKKDMERQRQQNPERSPVADYGNPELGSDEHMAAIQAMMDRDSKWRKKMKQQQKATENQQQQQQNDNDGNTP